MVILKFTEYELFLLLIIYLFLLSNGYGKVFLYMTAMIVKCKVFMYCYESTEFFEINKNSQIHL